MPLSRLTSVRLSRVRWRRCRAVAVHLARGVSRPSTQRCRAVSSSRRLWIGRTSSSRNSSMTCWKRVALKRGTSRRSSRCSARVARLPTRSRNSWRIQCRRTSPTGRSKVLRSCSKSAAIIWVGVCCCRRSAELFRGPAPRRRWISIIQTTPSALTFWPSSLAWASWKTLVGCGSTICRNWRSRGVTEQQRNQQANRIMRFHRNRERTWPLTWRRTERLQRLKVNSPAVQQLTVIDASVGVYQWLDWTRRAVFQIFMLWGFGQKYGLLWPFCVPKMGYCTKFNFSFSWGSAPGRTATVLSVRVYEYNFVGKSCRITDNRVRLVRLVVSHQEYDLYLSRALFLWLPYL